MQFNDLVKRVADVCPPFNHFALRDFVKEHINNSPEFPAMVFKEGFKFVNSDLEFIGYEVMSPEERVKFELRSAPGKTTRAKIPLTVTHMRLVRYRIRFEDQYVFSNIYTPYMFDDMLHIRDKRSMVRKVILEKTFSRVNEKDKDGLSVSPIRVNLTFNRRQTFRVASYISGEFYTHFVVTARLFHGTIRNKICDTTIVHYMLAKFGFSKTLTKFGLTKSDVNFVEEIGTDTHLYEYFAGKPFDDKVETGPGLFLKVKKTLLAEDQSLKFIINLLYVLSFFKIQTMENVYVEKGSIWKIILGIIILEDKAGPKAYSNAETHLKSVDSFIDPLTRDRFRTFGISIDDIYDLLVYIFTQIDTFMVNNQVQDLYSSRLDVSNGILVKTYAERIFKNIYYLANKPNINLADVSKYLRFNPMMFKQPSGSRSDEDKDYIAPPDIIGDNFLLSGGLNKIRLGGRAEQRLHPSMLVVESIDAFVGRYIGKTGYLNPFIPTDKNGAILHPDYTAEIDSIAPYLPR